MSSGYHTRRRAARSSSRSCALAGGRTKGRVPRAHRRTRARRARRSRARGLGRRARRWRAPARSRPTSSSRVRSRVARPAVARGPRTARARGDGRRLAHGLRDAMVPGARAVARRPGGGRASGSIRWISPRPRRRAVADRGRPLDRHARRRRPLLPSSDEAGFVAALGDLRSPLIAEALAHAEPIGPVFGNRETANRFRHYERWRHACPASSRSATRRASSTPSTARA